MNPSPAMETVASNFTGQDIPMHTQICEHLHDIDEINKSIASATHLESPGTHVVSLPVKPLKLYEKHN
jgi:hypothetical protein